MDDKSLAELRRRPLRPRFGLEKAEKVYLMMMFIVSGRWSEIGFSDDEAEGMLLQLIGSMKVHDHESNRRMFLLMQNTLMALRKDDFFRIQLEPPFSNEGLRNLNRLCDACVSNPEGFHAQWTRTFATMEAKKPQGVSVLSFTGGPGDCEQNAFCIEAIDPFAKVNAEYWYLNYIFGREFTVGEQYLTKPDELGRQFDVLQVKTPNSAERRYFFDVTSNFSNQARTYDVARYYE